MEEKIIEFQTAKLAKEKGFYEEVVPFFNQHLDYKLTEAIYESNWNETPHLISAPRQSLLQKWLREEHHIAVWLKPLPNKTDKWSVYVDDFIGHHYVTDYVIRKSYENALEEGLYRALKLI